MLDACSRIYELVTGARNSLFDIGLFKQYQSALPVISVGNVTAGGNAKTPLVILIVKELSAMGKKPVVLSRGYGGKIYGPYLVSSVDAAEKVGDEPLLISRTLSVPVVISRKRAEGAKFIAEKNLGDVIVLDDGFQHRWLKRDLDIVSVNCGTDKARSDFLKGELLPKGMFRENRDKALKRAGAVVFSERTVAVAGQAIDPALVALVPEGVPCFRTWLESEGVYSLASGEVLSACEAVAFCGLGNPENFFHSLEASGFSLKIKKAFSDHYAVSENDLSGLKKDGLPLICTAKDSVKIPEHLRRGVYELRVRTCIEPKEKFVKMLAGASQRPL